MEPQTETELDEKFEALKNIGESYRGDRLTAEQAIKAVLAALSNVPKDEALENLITRKDKA